MFRAIGIGYSRSLPAAAALNWLLKEGLGRLSRCIYTASLASAFDTNLKVFYSTVIFGQKDRLQLLSYISLWHGISLFEVVVSTVLSLFYQN